MSLFVSCIPVYHHNWLKRQEVSHWLFPRWKKEKKKSFNVLLVLACFVCTRIMVVLQYRNLLLLCGGISTPVVHCRSLIYSLLHCSLYVCSVCELNAISTVLWPYSVHGVTMTGNEWSAAFDDAHLRVWRATINIKQDYAKGILLLKATINDKYGKLQRTS